MGIFFAQSTQNFAMNDELLRSSASRFESRTRYINGFWFQPQVAHKNRIRTRPAIYSAPRSICHTEPVEVLHAHLKTENNLRENHACDFKQKNFLHQEKSYSAKRTNREAQQAQRQNPKRRTARRATLYFTTVNCLLTECSPPIILNTYVPDAQSDASSRIECVPKL